MSNLSMSPQVFSILTGLIEERVGISYTPAERELFASKAGARALEAGFDSMLDYYYYLRYDDPLQREFRTLVELLLVHETFFFREFEPLRVAITRFVVPQIEGSRRARIWCAACATGEEPLTIAMLLRELGVEGQVDLIASDLSESALARARRGVFSPRALRQHAQNPIASRYLETRPDAIIARAELVQSVDFRCINLLDDEAVSKLGQFDLVVCRNALIYFTEQRAASIACAMAQRLRPKGALLIGVSESLMRFASPLVCEEHAGAFVYRLPSAA
jgi:chemotaxis protein methyltransferase CheR